MSLALDPATTALVFIDLQNGTLGMPLAPYDREALLERAEALGRAFKAKGAPIALVRVAFAPDARDRPQGVTDVAMILPAGGFPAGWSDLAPSIAALEPAITVTKRQWGAFHGTEVDLQLRRRGVTTIVLGGIATNFGVEMTAREAWQHNYSVVIAEDACTSVAPDLHRFAIEKILPRVSRIRSTDEIIAALG